MQRNLSVTSVDDTETIVRVLIARWKPIVIQLGVSSLKPVVVIHVDEPPVPHGPQGDFEIADVYDSEPFPDGIITELVPLLCLHQRPHTVIGHMNEAIVQRVVNRNRHAVRWPMHDDSPLYVSARPVRQTILHVLGASDTESIRSVAVAHHAQVSHVELIIQTYRAVWPLFDAKLFPRPPIRHGVYIHTYAAISQVAMIGS